VEELMANPPIVIGPFANVPAPGSPIRSDWPQQLTTHVNNLGARYHNADYTVSESADIGTTPAILRSTTFTPVAGWLYDLRGYITVIVRAAGSAAALVRIHAGATIVNQVDVWLSATNVTGSGDISGMWRAPSSTPVLVKVDVARQWYSANNVRVIGGVGIPLGMSIVAHGPI
jgi:hypothetical protein